MEDRHVVVERQAAGRPVTFCAVYDGHGGAAVAALAAERLHEAFFDALDSGRAPREAFLAAYADVAALAGRHAHTGSTACTAAVIGSRLIVAWLGDSQLAVATPGQVRVLTGAHRMADAGERRRVLAAGGAFHGGYLMRGAYGVMVTRALGDAWFHPVGLVATPSVLDVELDATLPALVVLATDGLWDVVPARAIAEVVPGAAGGRTDHARRLVELALQAGGPDNVTVVTILTRPAD